jgi:carboxypeptidase Taq
MATQASTNEAYNELLDRYSKVADLESAAEVLRWDQDTKMPAGGNTVRSRQLARLSSLSHNLFVDERTGELLDVLEAGDLSTEQEAVVRELRFQYDRKTRVPEELVDELTAAKSDTRMIWEEAKAESDFDRFAPALENLRTLHVERARHIDPDKSPFEVMHEGEAYTDPMRDVPLEVVEDIFDQLREEIVPLVDEIKQDSSELPDRFAELGPYDIETQYELCEEALNVVQYDKDRGRLDTSAHPFTSGNQFDCRITTRFDEQTFASGLSSTIHEFGHAAYYHGIPKEHYGSPLGEARGPGVHESQSRFWENHIGRSRAFWERFLPTAKEYFPQLEEVTVDEAYQAVNRIYPRNRIRVEADELTYHLHIMLRYEIGRAFVEGDIDVEEIPDVWNDKMDEYLGVRPETDAEGCLQDIHWSGGFASFENYTVGSVLAAQLDTTMRDELGDVDELIRNGEFGPIHEWMTENIHRHGQRYRTDELIERATGEPLTAEYFIEYVKEKYSELYDL